MFLDMRCPSLEQKSGYVSAQREFCENYMNCHLKPTSPCPPGAWGKTKPDNLPFTTLYYANGPNWNVTWNGTHVVREDLTGTDTTDWEYQQPAGIKMKSETHGGEDVAIYASGQSAVDDVFISKSFFYPLW